MSVISYLFRKPRSGFYSVENVFREIIPLVANSFKIEEIRLPEGCAAPTCISRNLKSFRKTAHKGLFHITGHINYMALRTGRNTILTVHDIRSIFTGNVFLRIIKLVFWFWIPCWIVKRITVISEFSLAELRRLVPFAGRKAVVIPNPVHPDFFFSPPLNRDPGEKAGVLLVGTKPNKNLERSVQALSGLKASLTVIGELTDLQATLLTSSGLDFRNYRDLSSGDLVQCYRNCDLLLFPSLYEGFGMPIIEAQATGRPVITSDLGAMKETAGLGAHLVDPEDVASIRRGVKKILEDGAYGRQLVERGLENVKQFSPEKVAAKYMELYREMAENE